MQQAGQLHLVPEEHDASSGVCAEPGQLSVILQPEPTEHLDNNRRQDHEADQHREPEKVAAAIKLGGHPHIRAPVRKEGANSDHRENKIYTGVF